MAVVESLAFYNTATITPIKSFIVKLLVLSGGWIRTLDLRVSSGVLYHCATAAGRKLECL
jgi:hypothetical protein